MIEWQPIKAEKALGQYRYSIPAKNHHVTIRAVDRTPLHEYVKATEPKREKGQKRAAWDSLATRWKDAEAYPYVVSAYLWDDEDLIVFAHFSNEEQAANAYAELATEPDREKIGDILKKYGFK